MLGQLVPCGGGPPIALLKPRLLVGRHNYCDIPLNFATVSGRHCELEFLEGYWFVRDLGSSNGTHVNGVICSAQRLLPNDVLSVAKHRYTVVYSPPVGHTPSRGTMAPVGWGEGVPMPARVQPPVPPIRLNAGEEAGLGRLLPCGGGTPILLPKSPLVVGRLPGCDIVLPFGSVSARHCQLEYNDGQWSVRDLGSRNGIRVDGVRCESNSLPPGSVLAIANFRFQIVYKSRPEQPSKERSVFAHSLLAKAGLLDVMRELPAEEEDKSKKRQTLDDTD
jgi:pSer/pThr/pTyr-binding forkhead associated (FHA) protein